MIAVGQIYEFQPLVRHEVRILERIQLNRSLIVQRRMPSQEVEEGYVEDHISVCLFQRTVSVGWIVVLFECPVKALFSLLEGTILL